MFVTSQSSGSRSALLHRLRSDFPEAVPHRIDVDEELLDAEICCHHRVRCLTMEEGEALLCSWLAISDPDRFGDFVGTHLESCI